MAQASVSRQSIRDALTALDSQQLDPDLDASLIQAVSIARNALLRALAEDFPPRTQLVTVLIADLSGYTAIAERMDAEQVREAINAMWLELDAVVLAWGGRIDQHAGDSLRAVFGLPWERPNDAWRAVQAALALQLTLKSFNQRVRQPISETGRLDWYERWPAPQMRIGIHEGAAWVGDEHNGDGVTIDADTLRIAYELEEAAPPGGTFISAQIRFRLQRAFRLEAQRFPRVAFLVGQSEPDETEWRAGEVGEVVPRLIGRHDVLEALDDAFQRAADARSLEIITLVGEAGSGKTRVLQEFLPRLKLFTPDATVVHAHLRHNFVTRPYSLLRDLLQRYLHIYPAHSEQVIRARLESSSLFDGQPEKARQSYVAAVEQLLLANDGPAPLQSDMLFLAQALIVETAKDSALVIVCDDLHFADAYSLSLLDSLVRLPWQVPILVIGLAQPSLLESPSAAAVLWLGDLSDPFIPATQIMLPPLTAVESRLLAAELLRPSSPLPQRLIDLVVADAGGNPWAIEETVRFLIDLGLIVPGTRRPMDLTQTTTMTLPQSLPELVAARLQQLPLPDRLVIGAAAAVGQEFWDSEVIVRLIGEVAEQDVLAALSRLAASGWVYLANQLSRGGAQGYYFARVLTHDTALALSASEARQTHQGPIDVTPTD